MLTSDAIQALNSLRNSLNSGDEVTTKQIQDKIDEIVRCAATELPDVKSSATFLVLHIENFYSDCRVTQHGIRSEATEEE